MVKPTIPKGTRDFGPEEVSKRNYIFTTISRVFESYGFSHIETPAMENLSTLTGKYGEEGDKLLFKILNNGDYLAKVDEELLKTKDSVAITGQLSKRGLRYDLTVPFARFVTMHQQNIAFPFKRYQIQPVWRADRPQKGRYQEFYQCDADVVGSRSLLYEASFLQIFDEVFKALKIPVQIQVNNRKILTGIVEKSGLRDNFVAVVTLIDKWDKIGTEKLKEELSALGGSTESISELLDLLKTDSLDDLKKLLADSSIGQLGIDELEEIHRWNESYSFKNELKFTPTLARGLDYYTGCIFEVKAKDVDMGSIASGGRYDDLTAVFGLKDMSGVGISFGAERIYDVLVEKGLFPAQLEKTIDLLFIGLDEESLHYIFSRLPQFRKESQAKTDIYPEVVKMKKSMKYADQRNAGFVAIVGEEERKANSIALKNMKSGDQQVIEFSKLAKTINEHLA